MVRKVTKYSKEIRTQAETLRGKGHTYRQIFDLLNIPKSTLSTWFGEKYPGVFNKQGQREHLKRVRVLALEVLRKRKAVETDKLSANIKKEIEAYPLTDKGFLKSILASLYWAEGAKYLNSPMMFANTDPKLIKLFITLLRKCYTIEESIIKVRIHLHHYHNVSACRKYWSNLTNVPEEQFGKVYIKKRSKTKRFRKNFMGICFIRYNSNRLRKEIMALADQLSEKLV